VSARHHHYFSGHISVEAILLLYKGVLMQLDTEHTPQYYFYQGENEELRVSRTLNATGASMSMSLEILMNNPSETHRSLK
jgi:hypothetical protein